MWEFPWQRKLSSTLRTSHPLRVRLPAAPPPARWMTPAVSTILASTECFHLCRENLCFQCSASVKKPSEHATHALDNSKPILDNVCPNHSERPLKICPARMWDISLFWYVEHVLITVPNCYYTCHVVVASIECDEPRRNMIGKRRCVFQNVDHHNYPTPFFLSISLVAPDRITSQNVSRLHLSSR